MNGEVPHLYTIPSISFRACAFVGILLNLLSPVQIGDVKKNYIDTNRKYVSDGGRTEGRKILFFPEAHNIGIFSLGAVGLF